MDKFQAAIDRNEEPGKQAAGLDCDHSKDIARAYRKHGTRDSQRRNLIIQLVRAAAGRPGEVAGLSPDVMSWNCTFECEFATWPQLKIHKIKQLCIMAGSDVYCCVFMAFGCAMASGCFMEQGYDKDGMNYCFPDLANTDRSKGASATRVISGYIKDVSPQSNNVKYPNHKAKTLPDGATAAGACLHCIRMWALT